MTVVYTYAILYLTDDTALIYTEVIVMNIFKYLVTVDYFNRSAYTIVTDSYKVVARDIKEARIKAKKQFPKYFDGTLTVLRVEEC